MSERGDPTALGEARDDAAVPSARARALGGEKLAFDSFSEPPSSRSFSSFSSFSFLPPNVFANAPPTALPWNAPESFATPVSTPKASDANALALRSRRSGNWVAGP